MSLRLALAPLISAYLAWLLPFLVRRRGCGKQAMHVAPRARWGMILQGIAFGTAWFHPPSAPAASAMHVALALALAALGILVSYTATAALGSQWRFDAALNPDHHLIQSGPYAVVRHPIYASMLLMLIATALIVSNWLQLLIAVVFFFTGTEIRVRIEENLLIGHFGAEYESYRRRVPAYLPGLR